MLPWQAALLLLLLIIAILLLSGRRWLAVLLLAGALWGMADLYYDAAQMVVDASWLDHEQVITAEVDQVDVRPMYWRYRLRHIQRADGAGLSGNALLYQFKAGRTALPLQVGQAIRVRVRWHRPRNYLNPGGFDYRAWCFDHHIALLGSMRGKPDVLQSTVSWLEQARAHLRQRIQSSVAADQAGVLQAVLLGERGLITAPTRRVFSATGTAHLLAISGMHIGMAAAWVYLLIWFVLTRREAWIVALPVRPIAMLGGAMAAVAYATMAGWPLPAIRAVLMLSMAALSWCVASRAVALNTLLAALALILLFDPTAVLSLSLWLSFSATAALVLWGGRWGQGAEQRGVRRMLAAIVGLLWISLLATLATLPLVVANFAYVPLYSLPANLMMVPLYSLVVIPAGLLAELMLFFGMDWLAGQLMACAGAAIALGQYSLQIFTALPAGELRAVYPPLWSGLLYLCVMLCSGWWLWRQRYLRAACTAVLALSLYLTLALHESGPSEVRWVVWDVGQGAASTLLLPHKRVVVMDAPGHGGSRFNGGSTVSAGLRQFGLNHIDVLAISHAQSDHMGGALTLLHSVNAVGELWLPDVPAVHADVRIRVIQAYAQDRGIRLRWLARGDHIAVGAEAEFSVLWPPRGLSPAQANNTSLVLLASVHQHIHLLWPGDIEAAAEAGILTDGVAPVDAMLMPHHGSRTSSRPEFVARLHPSLVVAQTGFSNRYGFPKAAVVSRYRNLGADVRNTATGAVLVDWPNGLLHVAQWAKPWQRRDMALAFWQ